MGSGWGMGGRDDTGDQSPSTLLKELKRIVPFLEVLLSIFKLKSDAKYELCHQSLSALKNA